MSVFYNYPEFISHRIRTAFGSRIIAKWSSQPSICSTVPGTGLRVMPVHSDGRPSPENGLTNPAQRSPSTTVVPHTEAESTPLESSLSPPASTQRQPSPCSSKSRDYILNFAYPIQPTAASSDPLNVRKRPATFFLPRLPKAFHSCL